jgi:chemotaxis signal transduction protein
VPPDRSRPLPAACGDPRELPFSSVLDVEGSPLILELDVDRLHPDRPPYADRRSTFNRRRVAVAPAAPPAVARSESKSATHVLAFIVGAPVEGRETAIAVPMSQVLEIIDPLEVLHTPFGPPSLAGLARWRGRVIPILDLATRLGWPERSRGRERLAVVRTSPEGEPAGIRIHSQVQQIRLPMPHSASKLQTDPKLTYGAFDVGSRTLVVPDLAACAFGA